jgi:hypothetical protein
MVVRSVWAPTGSDWFVVYLKGRGRAFVWTRGRDLADGARVHGTPAPARRS